MWSGAICITQLPVGMGGNTTALRFYSARDCKCLAFLAAALS
jgi:hypothetical protein